SNDGSKQTKDYLNIINKNTQRLLDLSNQLLDFRRTETKGFQLNFVKTDVLLWTENILTRFYKSFEEKDKDLQFIKPDYPVEAFIDREAFAKITSNLLTNALKYSQKIIRVEIKIADSKFTLTVTNDGVLIPLNQKERIFTPFYRLKENETLPGSGIGLSLVQSLIDLHKGTISYTHTTDGMNRFIVSLPLG
ncbi:MAG: HAMP domain-containing histidine kinase, partial [Tannerellaceae bacterium]|nr:HAMP domain-containing histidine kinase [Tannerellaceae bacterium]